MNEKSYPIMRMKDHTLQIRLSEKEKHWIEREAKAHDLSTSEWVRSIAVPQKNTLFQEIIERVAETEEEHKSFAYAELHDFLAELKPEEFSVVLRLGPQKKCESQDANIVAAMVEFTAYKLGQKNPGWVNEVAPLKTPFFSSQLMSLRLYLLRNSPILFRRRNLFIDTSIGGRI